MTVHGVDATAFCDTGAVKTKREALALVDAVVAEVRASLSDPWNLWNEIDHRQRDGGTPCPVVAAVLAADPARTRRLLAGAAGTPVAVAHHHNV